MFMPSVQLVWGQNWHYQDLLLILGILLLHLAITPSRAYGSIMGARN